MTKLIDIAGNRYNNLLVVSYLGKSVWKCICDCGNYSDVGGSNLKNGHTKSCGCLRINSITSHGASRSNTYKTWEMMLQRCLNPNYDGYHRYGGRGITLEDSWRDFEIFLKDMGPRPDGKTLDRIDVNGNYTNLNCRWATAREQSFNKRMSDSNTSGKTGVHWHKGASKWTSYIGINNKSIYLGLFENYEDAVKCREEAEMKYYGKQKMEAT